MFDMMLGLVDQAAVRGAVGPGGKIVDGGEAG